MKPAKAAQWTARYQDAGGFSEVWLHQRTIELEGGLKVVVSHYPYYGDSRDTDRFRPQASF